MLDVVFTSITEVPYLEENGLLWEKVTYRTVRSLLFGLKLQNNIFIGDTINADDWCDENLKAFELPGEAFVLIAWRKNAKKEVLQFKDAFIKFYNDTLLSK